MLSYANAFITSITLQQLTTKVNYIQILQSECSLVWRENQSLHWNAAQSSKSLLLVSLCNIWLRNWGLRQVAWVAGGFFCPSEGAAKLRGDLLRSNPFAVSPLIFEASPLALSTPSSVSSQINFGKKVRLSSIEFCESFSCLSSIRFFNKLIGLFQLGQSPKRVKVSSL